MPRKHVKDTGTWGRGNERGKGAHKSGETSGCVVVLLVGAAGLVEVLHLVARGVGWV